MQNPRRQRFLDPAPVTQRHGLPAVARLFAVAALNQNKRTAFGWLEQSISHAGRVSSCKSVGTDRIVLYHLRVDANIWF